YPNAAVDIQQWGNELAAKYPELVNIPDENQCKVKAGSSSSSSDYILTKVAKELRESLDTNIFQDYHGIEGELERSTPEKCVESINTLSKVIGNYHKQIVFYSAFQGELLNAVKDCTTTNGFYKLITLTNLSRSHCYFLIKLHLLTTRFPKLIYCQRPLRYFSKNIKAIETVCETDKDFWSYI
ncbi:hypothetical protein OS493_038755, partial [Desmophyllum pertusum]